MDFLGKRYGNQQIIISSHITALVKFPALLENDDVSGLRKLFDEVNSHIRSLCTLAVQKDNYGTILASIVLYRGHLRPDKNILTAQKCLSSAMGGKK